MSKTGEAGPGGDYDAPGAVDLLADAKAERAAAETIAAEPYDGSKPATEIESDIARTRANISETLDALERRLAPRHLLERGIDMVQNSLKGRAGDVGATVTDALRGNPVPVALIGVGLGWLLLSNTRYGEAGRRTAARYSRSAARSVSDAVGSAAESVTDTAGRWIGQAREKVTGGTSSDTYAYARQKTERDAYGTSAGGGGSGAAADTANRATEAGRTAYRAAGEYAGSAAEYGRSALNRAGDYAGQAGQQASALRGRAAHVMEDYPLAVGALGFLAGALVAASLPATDVEDEWAGDASDQLWDEAKETGRDALERVQNVASTAASAAVDAAGDAARQAADTAMQEAERQGLMPGGSKSESTPSTSGSKPGAGSENAAAGSDAGKSKS